VFRACESEARERRRDRDPIAIVILGGKSRRKKKTVTKSVTVCAYGIAEIFFRALEQSAWKTRKRTFLFASFFLRASKPKTVARRAATARFCPSETHIYHYQ
jgi:hypothetical protein